MTDALYFGMSPCYYHVDRNTTPERILKILRSGVDYDPARNFYVDTDPANALGFVMSMGLLEPEELACERGWSPNAGMVHSGLLL